jgi:hypothetical protein
MTCCGALLLQAVIDVLQGVGAVDLRFPLSEKIQVGAMYNQYLSHLCLLVVCSMSAQFGV